MDCLGQTRLFTLLLLLVVSNPALIGASARQQRSAAQVSKAGWDSLNAGRIQEAAAAFDEAMRTGPQTPSTLLGAGLVARLQGRTDDVRRLLVDALKIEPSLTSASLLLGSVLYQTGDLDGAIETYQRALAYSPNHPQLTKQLDAWRKEADLHSGFRQTLGDHFTVMFEGPAEAELATRAVALLEAAYWRIGTALSTYPTGVTSVILYTREQFHDITRSPPWAGGSFDGRIRVPVQGALQNIAEFERVLAHEFTHALIQSVATRGVPTWLHEGLADCFDGSDIRKQLATSLPAYMLPSGYVFLDAFPYTATSKVDRNALAALDLDEVRFRPGYVPPEDWLEERVAAIFSEVLDQASVGRLDDFFLLGGDSLALVNLQILATEAFGRQFTELHEDATVAGVADWLRHTESGDEISAPILLPIRTAGSSPPLFVVHGRRGQAHVGPYFLDLLGDDQPLYALQARGLDGKQEPHRSIEEMAEEYAAAIKTVQPEGPYFIGGFCAGCYIALEMIRLLFREGELYYAPLLIDPPRPNFTNGSDDLSETVLLRKMERRVRSGEWKVELHNTRAVDAAVKVARAIEDALFAYEPRIIRVPSLVIATVRRWGTIAEVKKIFGDQSGVILVEGRHADMLDPKNAQFARAVRRCIAYVAERHRKNLERPKESADDIRNRRGLPAASQAV